MRNIGLIGKYGYKTKIKIILDENKFKDSYTMELIDTWMIITLKKNRIANNKL